MALFGNEENVEFLYDSHISILFCVFVMYITRYLWFEGKKRILLLSVLTVICFLYSRRISLELQPLSITKVEKNISTLIMHRGCNSLAKVVAEGRG